MGGLIALEIARELRRRGEAVDRVVMIDSRLPAVAAEAFDEMARFGTFLQELVGGGELPVTLDDLPTDDREAWLEAVRDRLPEDLLRGVDLRRIGAWFAVFERNLQAIARYRPSPCQGPVHLFRASDSRPFKTSLADHGWGDVVDGELVVEELSGDHYSILTPPTVGRLAARLHEILS